MRKKRYLAVLFLISAAAFFIRWLGIEHITADIEICLIPWSNAMKTGYGPSILTTYDGDYNMPYVTVLWLLNYLPGRTIIKVKLFSVLFDYLGAVAAGLIVANYASEGKKELYFTGACAVVLFYPSAILNSAYWGQCDFIYVTFLLYMIYALMKKRPGPAMALLGCAFSFKLQAVLILPILLIYWWKKRSFSAAYFLLVPVVMEILCLPAILGGHSVWIPFSVYLRQLGRYPYLYVFYPNFWALFRDAPYYIFSGVSTLGLVAVLGVFAVAVIRKKTGISEKQWMEFALWCVFFMMCFLPCMHERYGMLLEVLAILYAFLNRKTWWNAVIIGAGSYIAYLQVTFAKNIISDVWIALAYLTAFGFFTWGMIKNWDRAEERNSEKEISGGMSAWENRLLDFVNRYIIWIAAAIITVIAVLVRKPMIECLSPDYLANLIETEGNYHTPLYMLVMHLFTLLEEKPLLFLVKLLCILSDILAAALAAVCVYRENRKAETAFIIYGVLLFLPAVFINSPVWGHLDSLAVALMLLAWLCWREKRVCPAGIFAGLACGLYMHYALWLTAVVFGRRIYLWKNREKYDGTKEAESLNRFDRVCGLLLIVSFFTGLFCGYSPLQCLYKPFSFIRDFGTWMLYPALILLLLLSVREIRLLLAAIFMNLAAALDWGQFLYEKQVLPVWVTAVLYLITGAFILTALWKREKSVPGKGV